MYRGHRVIYKNCKVIISTIGTSSRPTAHMVRDEATVTHTTNLATKLTVNT